MLWKYYVFRRGAEVNDMWEQQFKSRPSRILYIAGRGFDFRVQSVLKSFAQSASLARENIEEASLLLIGFSGYQLSNELIDETERNAREMEEEFKTIGSTTSFIIGSTAAGEDDISPSNALRIGIKSILANMTNQTDIVLDISSLPRVVYLSLMTAILDKLIPNKGEPRALAAKSINFQVLVAEDAALDAQIRSEDPNNDLVLIPGFSSPLYAESVRDWPLVWFPILGENRTSQLEKVMMTAPIPDFAEICPVLPHPSRDPCRADRLIVEYKKPLFDRRQTPTTNILYAHESHPFEAYRQILKAMKRYRDSMRVIGGCRLVVTPLASKLITVGAGLACFEMRPSGADNSYGVAIPYAEPTRYVVSVEVLRASRPQISSLVLTGVSYE